MLSCLSPDNLAQMLLRQTADSVGCKLNAAGNATACRLTGKSCTGKVGRSPFSFAATALQ